MNGQDLSDIMYSIPYGRKKFMGVYRQDNLRKLRKDNMIVVNTGNHWVCIYFPKHGPIEYFDPLGHKPTPEIVHFLTKYKVPYVYNSKKIQGNQSIACGPFAILYASLRLANVKMKSITSLFSSNYVRNDEIAIDYLHSLI